MAIPRVGIAAKRTGQERTASRREHHGPGAHRPSSVLSLSVHASGTADDAVGVGEQFEGGTLVEDRHACRRISRMYSGPCNELRRTQPFASVGNGYPQWSSWAT